MIFYMQREVNEAESNLEIIIKYFSALADGAVPPPEELSSEMVKIIITTWVNLQDSISKLGYDVDVFRSYVAAKIESLKIRYGERTFEFHAGMKIICHEVDMRSLYWVKIVGPVFRKALTLPQASYSIVNLEVSTFILFKYLFLRKNSVVQEGAKSILRLHRSAKKTFMTITSIFLNFEIDFLSDVMIFLL